MKRTLLVLAFPLLLAGCAQVFDGNLFQSLDKPAPLDASALAKASPDEIRNRMKDDSFITQLKNDPTALKNTQTALSTAINDPNASSAQVIADATTLVELTASASSVTDMKAQATTNLGSISDAISAGNYGQALRIFMGSQTEAEITATLNNLVAMANALAVMQTKTTKADLTIDGTAFFAGTKDKGSFAESALMGAIAFALVTDNGGVAALATALATPTATIPSGGAHMTVFKNAKAGDPAVFTTTAGTATSPTYCYTYVATVIPELPLGL